MTQAFNLSQLANKVNTSGNLNASTGLFNQVPVANGGTGKSTVTSGALLIGAGTSAMTELVGTTAGEGVIWNGTTFVTGTVAGAADGVNAFVAPGTWTKPSGLLQVKVTVIGAGGAGGAATIPVVPGSIPAAANAAGGGGGGGGAAIRWIPAVTIPGPVAITAGAGTNSFGAFCSATAGGAGNNAAGAPSTNVIAGGGAAGAGTGGTINISGQGGIPSSAGTPAGNIAAGTGGASILGGGGRFSTAGGNYGGGGGGAIRQGPGSPGGSAGTTPGAAGAPGIVIVEEFY